MVVAYAILVYPKNHYDFTVKAMSNRHYCRNGRQKGSVTLNDLKKLIARGAVDGDTFVWQAGMSEWLKVRKHPNLVELILAPLPASTKTINQPQKLFATSVFEVVHGGRRQ